MTRDDARREPAVPSPPPEVDQAQLDALRATATGAGHLVVRMDLADCSDKADVLACASAAFRFPDWFGRNWDALSDSLGDLSWLDAPGYLVILENPQGLRRQAPRVWATMCEILDEVAAQRRTEGVAWRTVVIDRRAA